jgi:hypothetical protein
MRKVNPEYAKAIMAIANRAPYLKLLGMKICELDYGYCRVETQINDSLNIPLLQYMAASFRQFLTRLPFGLFTAASAKRTA